MTPAEIGAAVVGGLAVLGLSSAGALTLIKVLRNGKGRTVCPVDASEGLRMLADAVREQTTLLREIRDKLVGMGYEQTQAALAVGRVEISMQALHRRFDSISGPRE